MRKVDSDEMLKISGGVITTSDILNFLRPDRNKEDKIVEWNGASKIPSPDNVQSRIAGIGFFALTAVAAIFSGLMTFRR